MFVINSVCMLKIIVLSNDHSESVTLQELTRLNGFKWLFHIKCLKSVAIHSTSMCCIPKCYDEIGSDILFGKVQRNTLWPLFTCMDWDIIAKLYRVCDARCDSN